ncbi:response regulator [Candidatus Riflebacteria bacterium]
MKRILLVDDEKCILNTLSRDLTAENFEVVTATSAEEAFYKMQQGKFHMIITDLVMEGLDGIQVLKEAKKIDSQIGVIILTGHGDMTSAIDALRLGADDYVLKPCDFEELRIRLSRCLEKHENVQKIKFYEELLPICSICGMIRDDTSTGHGKGEWMKVDDFIQARTNAKVTHSYCPECEKTAIDEIISDEI